MTDMSHDRPQLRVDTVDHDTVKLSNIHITSLQVYLIIIIVPVVVVAVILIILLVVTVIFCAHIRRITLRKKRGMYQFSEFQNEEDIQLQ